METYTNTHTQLIENSSNLTSKNHLTESIIMNTHTQLMVNSLNLTSSNYLTELEKKFNKSISFKINRLKANVNNENKLSPGDLILIYNKWDTVINEKFYRVLNSMVFKIDNENKEIKENKEDEEVVEPVVFKRFKKTVNNESIKP